MDVCALNLKVGGLVWGAAKKGALAAIRQSSIWRVSGEEGEGNGGGLEVGVSARRRRSSLHRPLVVSAKGKKNNSDNPSSSGDNPWIDGDGFEGITPSYDISKSDSMHKSNTVLDWRDFRANLVAREQVHLLDSDAANQGSAESQPLEPVGLKWAHPIIGLETGCVLVATEKLDGVHSFERTVVLLLRLGTRDPSEGPFGVIINRPIRKKIKHMKLSNPNLATTFADSSLHFGGPLDASMFLMNTSENSSIAGFEQVVPGICFGARNQLDEATELVKKGLLRPQDIRFFVGYAGWQLDQLREEIESGYWIVAACSSYMIGGASADASSDSWGEILQLMGGQYSGMSRKPKQDSS